MSDKGRPRRVGELVREEIAQLIVKGLKDPRIGFVSVMSVRMSPDLKYANVYVSLYGSESKKKSSLVGLQRSATWLRGVVARNLKLRFAPEIRFFPDDTLDRVFHLEDVFRELHEAEPGEEAGKQQPGGEKPPEGQKDGGTEEE
ncbi:MAG: 30S ribosome-binding factor RbfA [Candidatus Hydrogenedentes bacterium]|nr:30S ribosome-binding factor RbfA [Candidatus Hydrogenedentota bacterium]